eukprot:TRINITY_DN10311_c1_g2_i1.p1 TRINITY_DN10311_c1_g2~~TRINITY_DN10311_c1_g2_i1.p1  ORF type:complete len:621 (+),score=117.95 TRINITY_DN10311_c1_g2_i1:62-1924(+)
MYGFFHIILKDLAVTEAGDNSWTRILSAAGVDASEEANLLDMVMHTDDISYSLMESTWKVLGLDADTALRLFGRHFVRFCLRIGHAAFLKSQGPTLPSFLMNVNSLHTSLERDHPNARFPFLEVVCNELDGSVDLTYLSTRSNLKMLPVGIIEEIGIRLYGLDVVFTERPLPAELQGSEKRAAAWKVTWTARPGGAEPLPQMETKSTSFQSFFQLHGAMVDFMRLLTAADSFNACFAGVANSRAVKFSQGNQDREEVAVAKRDSRRKKTEMLKRGPHDTDALVDMLFRMTRAETIAASWADPSLAKCRSFWQDSHGRVQDYSLSEDAEKVDVFVSHSWSGPDDWSSMMGDVNYADLKSTQLAAMAKDVAVSKSQSLSDWRSITFWVDKACIAQDVPDLKETCIKLIGNFIQKCDRVCVLFTWHYLERLWCVYEMAHIMQDKDPSRVFLQVEAFVNEQTFPLYLQAIRDFGIHNTKCCLESDRELLKKQIERHYVSNSSFELLVKSYSVALMARSMAYRAGRSQALMQKFFQPIVDLTEDLGLLELASTLKTCKPMEWRRSASDEQVTASIPARLRQKCLSISMSRYHDHINNWFRDSVTPVLQKMRQSTLNVQCERVIGA